MKNNSALILLFIANTISGIAQGISMIAIPWYFAANELMTEFGIAYGISTIISFFWVPFSGSIVDRYSRKKVFLWICAISGSFTLLVSSMGFYQGQLHWVWIALVFMFTFFNYNIHYPNLYAFAQEITEKDKYSRITSLLEVFGQSSTMLAGAAAAILLEGLEKGERFISFLPIISPVQIEPWSIQKIFAMDGSTYFAAFILIALIRYTSLWERKTDSSSGILERLKLGWQWLLDNRPILLFGIGSYMVFATVMIIAFYTGASYVKLHLQESGDIYASSEIFYSLGALTAGVFMAWIFSKIPKPLGVIILTVLTIFTYMTLGLTTSILILYGSMFLIGITNAGIRVLRVTYLFSQVPNAIYGRVSSIFFLFNLCFRTLLIGAFSLPFFQTTEHIKWTFIIMAVLLCFVTIFLVLNYRQLRTSKLL